MQIVILSKEPNNYPCAFPPNDSSNIFLIAADPDAAQMDSQTTAAARGTNYLQITMSFFACQ